MIFKAAQKSWIRFFFFSPKCAINSKEECSSCVRDLAFGKCDELIFVTSDFDSESVLWAAWKNVITDSECCNEVSREANRVNKWRGVPKCHLCPLAGSFFIVSCLNSFISFGFRFEWNMVEYELPTVLNQILFPLKSSLYATKRNYDESMWFIFFMGISFQRLLKILP